MNVLSMLRPKYLLTYLQDEDLVEDGLRIMSESGYTAVPVIDKNGKYSGSVSEGDFLRVILEHGVECCKYVHIKDIIKNGWITPVKDDVSLEILLQRSLSQNYVPMIDDRNCFIGIITRREIIKGMLEQNKEIQLQKICC